MSSMNRRQFLATAAGGAVAAVMCPQWAAAGEARADLPNVLFLHCDELSAWGLSCYAPGLKAVPNYGKTVVPTPHIDRLAAEGAIFHNFFTNSAVCTPSRGCIFTGRYPHAHGAYKNDVPMNRDEVTLARLLASNGYDTGYCGKWHLDGPPKPGFMKPDRSMGFADCRYMFNRGHWKELKEQPNGDPIDPKGYAAIGDEKSFTTDCLAAKTIEFIGRPRTRPFFWVVSWPDPHPPFTVRAPYMDMYKPDDMPVPHTYRSGADLGADAEDAGQDKPAQDAAGKKAAKKGGDDRDKDPEQAKNLAGDPASREEMRAMGKRILAHHEQVASPAAQWLKDAVAAL